MTETKRIQLSRAKGYRKPEGAITVSRPSKWGNPFKVGEAIERDSDLWPYVTQDDPAVDRQFDLLDRVNGRGLTSLTPISAEHVVALYGWWFIEQPALMLTVEEELGGRDLACWCKTGQPCHADFLLEMARA